MGIYIYARTSDTKTYPTTDGTELVINRVKFLFKPVGWGMSDWAVKRQRQEEVAVNRYIRNWEGKDYPRFIILKGKEDSGMKEFAVLDTHDSDHGEVGAVFSDSGNFGNQVGVLRKIKGRWTFVEGADL